MSDSSPHPSQQEQWALHVPRVQPNYRGGRQVGHASDEDSASEIGAPTLTGVGANSICFWLSRVHGYAGHYATLPSPRLLCTNNENAALVKHCSKYGVTCSLTVSRHQLALSARSAGVKDTHTFIKATIKLLTVQTE